MIDSTNLLKKTELLRSRAEHEGYLFFSQLLDKQKIINLRGKICFSMKKMGWLEENSVSYDALVKKGIQILESSKPEWKQFYRSILLLREFHAVSFYPELIMIMETLFNQKVLPHCRNILRVFSPARGIYCTPPHRDYTWTGGTEETWTAWLPLGNLSTNMGGLQLIPGSHKKKYLLKGNDEREGLIIDDSENWISSPSYQLGDVVLFHSKTVHAGSVNKSQKNIRLSIDVRFQPVTHEVRSDSLKLHWDGFGLTWDEIYSHWEDTDPLKYYWKQLPLKIIENTDNTYHQDIRKRYILNLLHAIEKRK